MVFFTLPVIFLISLSVIAVVVTTVIIYKSSSKKKSPPKHRHRAPRGKDKRDPNLHKPKRSVPGPAYKR
jgi:hypothetical protein